MHDDPYRPWTVPHAEILEWIRDVGRYQWLAKQFVATAPGWQADGTPKAPIWHLPSSLLLRFPAPTIHEALDQARTYATQSLGTRIWVGDDPH